MSYRKHGETAWKQGRPLLRLNGERIYRTEGVFNVISPNMFAGSILDLEPDTAYEARFTARYRYSPASIKMVSPGLTRGRPAVIVSPPPQ